MDVSRLFISALIYVAVFSGTISLFAIAERGRAYSSNIANYLCKNFVLALAILLPCFLAGFRANSVGVDVEVYVVPHMRAAVGCSSFSEVYNVINGSMEYLYVLLVFIVSRITENEGVLLFLLQLFTILPITLAVIKMKGKISLPLAMAVYLFIYYNNSLNMMRQSVACGFVLLGTVHLLENKGRVSAKAVMAFATAFFFHKSGLIGIILVVGVYYLMRSKLKKMVKFCILVVVLLFPILVLPIYEFLIKAGILTGNYLVYGDIFLYRTMPKDWFINPFSSTALAYMVLNGILVIIPGVYIKKNSLSNDSEFQFFRFLVAMGFLLCVVIILSMQTLYGQRITMYLDMFIIVLLPFSVRRPNLKLKRCITYSFLLMYWLIWIMRLGWSGSNYLTFRF